MRGGTTWGTFQPNAGLLPSAKVRGERGRCGAHKPWRSSGEGGLRGKPAGEVSPKPPSLNEKENKRAHEPPLGQLPRQSTFFRSGRALLPSPPAPPSRPRARSRSGSGLPLAVHSLPSRRFATSRREAQPRSATSRREAIIRAAPLLPGGSHFFEPSPYRREANARTSASIPEGANRHDAAGRVRSLPLPEGGIFPPRYPGGSPALDGTTKKPKSLDFGFLYWWILCTSRQRSEERRKPY